MNKKPVVTQRNGKIGMVSESLPDQLTDLHSIRVKDLVKKCHLWNVEVLSESDLDNAFDVLKTYSEQSHFSRRLVQCTRCGLLYIKEFYEETDWIDGEDPQYETYIPLASAHEAEAINKADLLEFQTFSPRINRDWPKGKPRRIYWVGK